MCGCCLLAEMNTSARRVIRVQDQTRTFTFNQDTSMPKLQQPVNEAAVRERHAAGVGIKAIMNQFKIGAARVREICGIEEPQRVDPVPPAEYPLWTIEIDIPAIRLTSLIMELDRDEAVAFLLAMPPKTQADAIMFTFQRRMDAVPTQEVAADGSTES